MEWRTPTWILPWRSAETAFTLTAYARRGADGLRVI